MKNLIMKVKLFKIQITNECFFKKNEKILKFIFDSENNEKSNTEEIIIFDKKKNYKLIRTLENALLILSFFKVDVKITFHI